MDSEVSSPVLTDFDGYLSNSSDEHDENYLTLIRQAHRIALEKGEGGLGPPREDSDPETTEQARKAKIKAGKQKVVDLEDTSSGSISPSPVVPSAPRKKVHFGGDGEVEPAIGASFEPLREQPQSQPSAIDQAIENAIAGGLGAPLMSDRQIDDFIEEAKDSILNVDSDGENGGSDGFGFEKM